jgi:predicted flap endonuclease-1-like 5' DNA nuclease
MQANGKNYLITNWHVLSGRNPSNDQPLNANGITPDQIAIWHHERGKRVRSCNTTKKKNNRVRSCNITK